MFVGRDKELNKLNEFYNRDAFEFVVIYGRRRVGKTTLINEFIKDKKAIFYSGLELNEKQNLEQFSSSILSTSGMDVTSIFRDFNDALEQVYSMAKEERIVLVIDEYPYLSYCYSGISSLLASFIDHKYLKSKLFLILCGSSLSFMENQVLGYQSPLYGRRTAQMKIAPFSFAECLSYYKKFNKEEMALIYGITGGIPLYMSKMEEDKSVEDNIKDSFFDTSSYLFEEPGNLIKQECREPMQYNSIIKAIATGSSRMNEIYQKAGLDDSSSCSNYISKLMSLGIIKKEFPYKVETSKKTIYRLADSMFQFWYRFVLNNMGLIGQGARDKVYGRIEEQIPSYMGFVFDEMCKQYLWQENLKERLRIEFSDMGRWWGNDPTTKSETEIDIMADNDRGEVLFAECKWTKEKVDESILADLEHRSTLFHYTKVVLYLFSKSGFTKGCIEKAKAMGNVELVSYEDMNWIL